MMAPAPPPARSRRLNLKVLGVGLLVVLPLLVILILNLGRDPHSVRSPLIGRAAPSFALAPVAGGPPVSLESLRGTPVVMNFWATWCVPCLEEHEALVATAHANPDVQFLGIVYEDEEAQVKRFLTEREDTAYPSLLDPEGKTAIAYGVYGVPETYFIDVAGRVVDKFVGPLTPEALEARIAQAKGSLR
jgi:cytochrome c biogenesis protein CcmG, thiol:disulfide interchange protein DsbE